jgi:hypothetical protein
MAADTSALADLERIPTRRRARLLQSSIESLRTAAWDRYVNDYVNAVDDDPADARARYRAEMADIELTTLASKESRDVG